MALTYKNQITGREVTVLEPKELGEKLRGVKRRGRPLDPRRIVVAVKRREQTIKKMNDSWKWERIDRPARKSSKGNGGGQKSGKDNGGGQSSEGNQGQE